MKLFLLLSILSLCAACSNATESATPSTGAAAQTCRRYPTSLTDTTNSINYTCTFNGSTTVSCTNGGTETITYTYPSLQKFVDEAITPVSVFNKYTFTSLVFGSATASNQYNFTLTYNGSGQHTGLTVVNNGVTAVSAYSSWDTHGRPTAGTAQFTAGATCTGRNLSIVYVDGTTRSRTTTASSGTGGNCALLTEGTNITDANGIASLAVGNNFTINATSQQCY